MSSPPGARVLVVALFLLVAGAPAPALATAEGSRPQRRCSFDEPRGPEQADAIVQRWLGSTAGGRACEGQVRVQARTLQVELACDRASSITTFRLGPGCSVGSSTWQDPVDAAPPFSRVEIAELEALLRDFAVSEFVPGSPSGWVHLLRSRLGATDDPGVRHLAVTLYPLVINPALWMLFLACSAFILARDVRRLDVRSRLALAGTVVLGVVLSLTAGPSTLGDIGHRTNHDAYASAHTGFGLYGLGVESLLYLVSFFTEASDRTLAALNVVAAALSVVALHGLVRVLNGSPRSALTAALFLASSPLFLRFNHTFERLPVYLLLALVGLVTLLTFLRRRRTVDLVASMAAFVLAAQCRPEGFTILLPAAGLGAAAWHHVRTMDRASAWRLGLAACLTLALLAVPVYYMVVDKLPVAAEQLALRRHAWHPGSNVFLNGSYTPLAWTLLAVVGLWLGDGLPWRARAWLLATALLLTELFSAYAIDPYHRSNARYYLASLPFYYILAAAGLHGALSRGLGLLPAGVTARFSTGIRLVSTLAVAGLSIGVGPRMLARTTVDQEYAFLAENLKRVPAGCTIVSAAALEDGGYLASSASVNASGREYRWRDLPMLQSFATPQTLTDGDACAVFYLSGNCSIEWWHAPGCEEDPTSACRPFLVHAGPALAEARLTNVPFRGEVYRGESVKVGLYWLTPPAGDGSRSSNAQEFSP
jgi:hypothetical protein